MRHLYQVISQGSTHQTSRGCHPDISQTQTLYGWIYHHLQLVIRGFLSLVFEYCVSINVVDLGPGIQPNVVGPTAMAGCWLVWQVWTSNPTLHLPSMKPTSTKCTLTFTMFYHWSGALVPRSLQRNILSSKLTATVTLCRGAWNPSDILIDRSSV